MCTCDPPYAGDYCGACPSIDRRECSRALCEPNRACANCVLDIIAPAADMITIEEYFNESMVLQRLNVSSVKLDTTNMALQIVLPASTCSEQCKSGAVIINGTETPEYKIEGMDVSRRILSVKLISTFLMSCIVMFNILSLSDSFFKRCLFVVVSYGAYFHTVLIYFRVFCYTL